MFDTIKGLQDKPALDGSGLRVLVVHTRWNSAIVDRLVKGVVDTLTALHVARSDIVLHDVPGAFELPFGTQQLLEGASARGSPFDACISIGVLIKGSTMHFEYIADATSHGLMSVGLKTATPVIFGVLTCLTEEQAMERAGAGRDAQHSHNHGIDWAKAAVEMATLNKSAFASS
ncbi:6,7-dimethyl-8-ribityllumazine synthase [Entophlyctis helioformis]|nr:6,7-dimethyl-8-ribityllumazine synthase [Entophlyctis helioformis]